MSGMDVPEEKYRKVIGQFKGIYSNILTESPVPHRRTLSAIRNLKYIAAKAQLADSYPYYHPLLEETLEDIRVGLLEKDPETKALALRLGRALPFLFRIRLIERCENELVGAGLAEGYSFEGAADLGELLLSVFEVTSQNEDIYFDVNQRIVALFSRFLEGSLSSGRVGLRNACEVLRAIFLRFGYSTTRSATAPNKLIHKLLNTFGGNSFVGEWGEGARGQGAKVVALAGQLRQLEGRVRVRGLLGLCCLSSYFPGTDSELLELLGEEVLGVLENISQCDVVLDCFNCMAALGRQEQPFYCRARLVKRWAAALVELPFRKEYLEHYLFLLELSGEPNTGVPQRTAYSLALHCLEVGRPLQQQFSRLLLCLRACRIIVGIARRSYKVNPQCNLLLQMFQYGWFIERISQQDLFKSQFAAALLQQALAHPEPPTPPHLLDLLDIASRLLDWRCLNKEETHFPTVKLAFEMYLQAVGWACPSLQDSGAQGVEAVVEGLVNRCNDASIYLFFKFKLVLKLLSLNWYRDNHQYLKSKLDFELILRQVVTWMMPKNPKPIFSYQYSLTYDGEVESRKEIEEIKVIMELLTAVPKVHDHFAPQFENTVISYHAYLGDLEVKEDANRELINCLQTLEADYYLNSSQRQFLLSLLPSSGQLNCLNYETNLEGQILFSPCESLAWQEEVNVFGPMSPVQLSISVKNHPSYASAYIHVKKNQWVNIQADLKLVVSSGVEKKELPLESGILQIKVDRVGALHFEVWKDAEESLLLGSGSHRIRRRLQWLRTDHLRLVDGIHSKAYFKEGGSTKTFLSCYYGEPLLVRIDPEESRVVVGVPSKQIYNELRDLVPGWVQELSSGTAELIQDMWP